MKIFCKYQHVPSLYFGPIFQKISIKRISEKAKVCFIHKDVNLAMIPAPFLRMTGNESFDFQTKSCRKTIKNWNICCRSPHDGHSRSAFAMKIKILLYCVQYFPKQWNRTIFIL